MLTIEQSKEYLAAMGINLPDFVLQLLVDQGNGINLCLDANYDPATANLIRLYLLGLLGIANGDRYVSSQTAPSGASQSFRYHDYKDRWRSTYGLLRALDKHGCASGLIPADPTMTARAGLWTAKGGCMQGGR